MSRLIIDVREPKEYARGHVKGAINLPPARLLGDSQELEGVPKDTKIVLYCRTGNRSGLVMNILRVKGYTNVINGINRSQVEAKYL